jgi:hypothetical protein
MQERWECADEEDTNEHIQDRLEHTLMRMQIMMQMAVRLM